MGHGTDRQQFFSKKQENPHIFPAKWSVDINLKPSVSKERHKQQKRKSRTNRVMGFIQLPIYTIFAQVKLSIFSADKNCICQDKSSALLFLHCNFWKGQTPSIYMPDNRWFCRLSSCMDRHRIWKAIRYWSSALVQQNCNCYHKKKMTDFFASRV